MDKKAVALKILHNDNLYFQLKILNNIFETNFQTRYIFILYDLSADSSQEAKLDAK